MEMNVLTKENLGERVKEILGIAPDSIMKTMIEKLEYDGPESVIQYLYYLRRICLNRGLDPYSDDYMRDIIKDSLFITDFCERRENSYPV